MDNATPSNTSVANETVALAQKLAASWGSWNEYEIQALAAALREAKAQAFEEARARAQIEVNACTSQVKAAAPRDRRIHEAARGVAQVIVRWCGLAAEGCRSAQDAPGAPSVPGSGKDDSRGA